MKILNRSVTPEGNILYTVGDTKGTSVLVKRCWYKGGYDIEGIIPAGYNKYDVIGTVFESAPAEDSMMPRVERKARMAFKGLRDTCYSLKQALAFAELCLNTSGGKDSWEYLRIVNGDTVIKDLLV